MRIPSPKGRCLQTRLDRSKGIGSSEIAAVLGLSPFLDPWELWARKAGLIGPRLADDRMRGGTHLQRGIANWFGERMGAEVTWWDKPCRHPQRKWQRASADAFVRLNLGGSLLEVKNIALDQAGEWSRDVANEEGVPDHYAVQAHWQMSVYGVGTCWIAALVAGNDLRVYELHYDPQVERDLVRAGERFWFDHVVANVPPPMGPSRAAHAWLGRKYPRQRENLRRAEEREINLLEDYARVRAELKPLTERKQTLENELQAAIGDAEGLWWEGGKFTWKRTKDSMVTDWEELIAKLLMNYPKEERETIIQAYTYPQDGVRRIDFRLKKET